MSAVSNGALTPEHIVFFENLLGKQFVFTDEESLNLYAHDETEDIHFLPDVVLKPKTTNEISAIMKLCNRDLIPVTPRGGGTGLNGGALAHLGAVVLSTERMNAILTIDEWNLQVITEPGVITEVLQDAVKEKGLFYPPDPQSKGSCFIGGNIAENSGGPKAVKYGVVDDYVLNLEIVLPNGDIIWTGANVLKNATGYNLTQLIVGSEGTLAIVTKIVLKLIPLPKYDLLILAPFNSAEEACASISAIFMAGYVPSAVEFMERDAMDWTLKHFGNSSVNINANTQAYLLIEVDGNNMDVLMKDIEEISAIIAAYNCGDILFAEDIKQKEMLWRLRMSIGEAIKSRSIYRDEDTVVPRAELPLLLRGVKQIGEKFGFKTVCFGHAGDGNMHISIIKDELTQEQWNGQVKEGIREIFRLVKSLNGTISGEHGIGLVQKEYLDIVFDQTQMNLMKGIKKIFDPNNILNAGKIFDL
ncbi:FAD-binding oxidoreductase [Agriterribacter sp.]|uniref:FAD-binding oxidoreductase n=1 Tax=Agriterribacter sp. TaxID=2821509 RepID=UPI002C7A1F0F|nr:FAD-linked oxidase C-terminal domain-containing protein [Agriterribacter sp.]HTN08813.1 FAD-linked oxidase C-terminal domain-containing protein [Agriterribacter sp.]